MFKNRKRNITDAEKLDAILEYLNDEMTRWQLAGGPAASQKHNDKVNARVMYLEEQIALTTAQRALENINPNAK